MKSGFSLLPAVSPFGVILAIGFSFGEEDDATTDERILFFFFEFTTVLMNL